MLYVLNKLGINNFKNKNERTVKLSSKVSTFRAFELYFEILVVLPPDRRANE